MSRRSTILLHLTDGQELLSVMEKIVPAVFLPSNPAPGIILMIGHPTEDYLELKVKDLETGDVWHNKNFQWERHKGILVIKDGRVLMTEIGEAHNKTQETKDGKKGNVCARPNRRRRAQHHGRQSPRRASSR